MISVSSKLSFNTLKNAIKKSQQKNVHQRHLSRYEKCSARTIRSMVTMPTSSFFNQNQPHLKKHSYRLNHHVKYYRYMKTSDVPSHHRSISSTAILQSTSTPSSESSRLPPLLSSISSDTIATIQTLPEISDIISNIDTQAKG